MNPANAPTSHTGFGFTKARHGKTEGRADVWNTNCALKGDVVECKPLFVRYWLGFSEHKKLNQ